MRSYILISPRRSPLPSPLNHSSSGVYGWTEVHEQQERLTSPKKTGFPGRKLCDLPSPCPITFKIKIVATAPERKPLPVQSTTRGDERGPGWQIKHTQNVVCVTPPFPEKCKEAPLWRKIFSGPTKYLPLISIIVLWDVGDGRSRATDKIYPERNICPSFRIPLDIVTTHRNHRIA